MPRHGWRERKSGDLSLAGQDATYLASALQAYKQGARNDETMKGLAASLDDGAVKNLAAFYASQEPKQPNVHKPLSAEEWAQRWDRCHGVNGNSADPRLPALAAQRLDYLEKGVAGLSDRRAQEPSDGGNVWMC
jgi:cytochrome c553